MITPIDQAIQTNSQIDSILSAVHSDESQIDRLFGDDESLEFYGGFEHQSKFSVH